MELFEMASEIVEKMQDGETLEGNYEDSRRTIAVKNTRWHYGQLLHDTFYTNLFTVQASCI
jgi:hypothetical protein